MKVHSAYSPCGRWASACVKDDPVTGGLLKLDHVGIIDRGVFRYEWIVIDATWFRIISH
jgi:hypothetical protein